MRGTSLMKGEKPGGHGERCVAVGTLDMHRFPAQRIPQFAPPVDSIAVYAGGGYVYPSDDIRHLTEEIRALLDAGYTHVKIKIGALPLNEDLTRIEAVLALLPAPDRLAVDAMNAYDAQQAIEAAAALEPYGLWWFEDICDPLDFETHAKVASQYSGAAAGAEVNNAASRRSVALQ